MTNSIDFDWHTLRHVCPRIEPRDYVPHRVTVDGRLQTRLEGLDVPCSSNFAHKYVLPASLINYRFWPLPNINTGV